MGINLGIPAWVSIHENESRCHILIRQDLYVSKRNLIHCVHAAHETDIDVEQIGEGVPLHEFIGEADDPTLDLAGAHNAIDTSGARLNALLVAEDHYINGGTVKESLIVGEEHICEAALVHHTSENGRGTGLFKEIRRDDEDELAARCQKSDAFLDELYVEVSGTMFDVGRVSDDGSVGGGNWGGNKVGVTNGLARIELYNRWNCWVKFVAVHWIVGVQVLEREQKMSGTERRFEKTLTAIADTVEYKVTKNIGKSKVLSKILLGHVTYPYMEKDDSFWQTIRFAINHLFREYPV
jgi:hypothetical protein